MFHYSIIFAMLLCGNVLASDSAFVTSIQGIISKLEQKDKFEIYNSEITQTKQLIDEYKSNSPMIEKEQKIQDVKKLAKMMELILRLILNKLKLEELKDEYKLKRLKDDFANLFKSWEQVSNILPELNRYECTASVARRLFAIKDLLDCLSQDKDDKGFFYAFKESKIYLKSLRSEFKDIRLESSEIEPIKQTTDIYFLDAYSKEKPCTLWIRAHDERRRAPTKNDPNGRGVTTKVEYSFEQDRIYDYANSGTFGKQLEVKMIEDGKVEFTLRQGDVNSSLLQAARDAIITSYYKDYTVQIKYEDYLEIKQRLYSGDRDELKINLLSCKEDSGEMDVQKLQLSFSLNGDWMLLNLVKRS